VLEFVPPAAEAHIVMLEWPGHRLDNPF
jgi:hypothetical protein